jgi:hypothetical protein
MTVTPFEVGDPVTADALDEQFDPPMGRLRQGTTQTGLASAAVVAITFAATDELDTHGFHDPASSNTKVTPTVPGWYDVRGGVSLAGQTDFTVVQAVIGKSGASFLAPAHRITPSASAQSLVLPVQALVQCNGTTDYFELYASATRSGAGVWATVISSQFACVLEWKFERPL